MTQPRIALLGSGAQGSGIGADLVRAGHNVTLIEQWPAHVERMRTAGIEVRMPDRTEITDVTALHLCEVATVREPFDLVFLVMKAYDTAWACELIRPVLADDGLVIGLQNGMSHEDIARVVGRERAVGAVIEMASNMFEPGIVTRQNPPEEAWFALGALDRETAPRIDGVAEILHAAGTVEVTDDIRSAKWMKLIANAGELVPSAILDLPLEDAAALDGFMDFMIECGREAARAALADGSRLVPIFGLDERAVTTPEQYAADLLGQVLSRFSRPDTLTTVLQDWKKGRRSEFREVNGFAAGVLAKTGGVAPCNRHTTRLAAEIERGERERGVHNLDELVSVFSAVPDVATA